LWGVYPTVDGQVGAGAACAVIRRVGDGTCSTSLPSQTDDEVGVSVPVGTVGTSALVVSARKSFLRDALQVLSRWVNVREGCDITIIVLDIVQGLALATNEHWTDISENACYASEQNSVEGTHFGILKNENECPQVGMNDRQLAPGK
jgi:hypothetical protein